MAIFHRASKRRTRTSAYIDDPGSAHHARLGTLGRRVGRRQALTLPGGGHVWASVDALERVDTQSENAAWKSADGKYRIGDMVRVRRTGLAEIIAGPVPTPLGIVYRLEDKLSGNEFDEWEHELSAGPEQYVGSAGFDYATARVGDALVDKWGNVVKIVEPYAPPFTETVKIQYEDGRVASMYPEGMRHDGFKPVEAPNFAPWSEVDIKPELQRDTPEQAETLVRNAGWMSRTSMLIKNSSALFKTHMLRHAFRMEAAKIDKLADKARQTLFKRPDVQQWMEGGYPIHVEDAVQKLRDFVDNMPSDAFKALPWMWTQIKANPNILIERGAQQDLYDVGSAFHLMRQNNKPTPDLHQLDAAGAIGWLHSVQSDIDAMKPVEWENPKVVHKLSDGRHSVHQINRAADCVQEGNLMGHCIGGQHYQDAAESGKGHYFSIRDEKNRPHTTIEMIPQDAPANIGFRPFPTENLKAGDRILVPGPNGATVLKDVLSEGGAVLVDLDDEGGSEVVEAPDVAGYYKGRYKSGDMVTPTYSVSWLKGRGPFRIGPIRIAEDGSYSYYLDSNDATTDKSGGYMPEVNLTLADGSVPDRPSYPVHDQEMPQHHKVTQVFGKSDQAPISKYRKMVREFFDNMRENGHTLEWAANEFLPNDVQSLSDAERVYDFLTEMQEHMDEQENNGEDPGLDGLGMAHSLIESGAMAHEYGFDDIDPEVMRVDWRRLMTDYAQQITEGGDDYSYGGDSPDEMTEWIRAVILVKRESPEKIGQILNATYDELERANEVASNSRREQAQHDDWQTIHEIKREIIENGVSEDAARDGIRVDHGLEQAWRPEWEEDDSVDEFGLPAHELDAERLYEELLGNQDEDAAHDEAIEQWEENWEDDELDDHSRRIDDLKESADPYSFRVSNLIDAAMNPKIDDSGVNMRWSALMQTLSANRPPEYAYRTDSLHARLKSIVDAVHGEVARKHAPQGWQQVMPKGEEVKYNTSDRVDQVVEALDRLVQQIKTDSRPDSGAHLPGPYNDVGPYLKQHSLHEPIHSAPAPKAQQPYVEPPSSRHAPWSSPPQKDMLMEQHQEGDRAQSPLKDTAGQGLIAGDVVQHPKYGRGVVDWVNTSGYARVHFPTNGLTTIRYDDPSYTNEQLMARVGSWRLAAEESDPDWSFVYYTGEVKLVEWSHQNRYRQILKDLLSENGKELVDDIDDTDIVGGTVTNGKVEFEGFAAPEVREEAEAAIAKVLGSKPKSDEPSGEGPTIKVEISIDGWDVKGT